MAYRNIVIENPARISCKNNQLVISADQTHTLPIEDLLSVLIESRQSTLTSAALAALAQNGTAVYVCDEKHLPCGTLLPYAQHCRQTEMVNLQLQTSLPLKKRLWQQVVAAKIRNQAECLALCGKSSEAAYLYSRAKTVQSGDSENAEGTAAAYYFTALFGKAFTRGADDGRNSAMNYGYAILRGCAARALTACGFLCCFGLHHCNALNAFNLADDIMEPFRPVVDLFTAANVAQHAELSPSLKHALFNLLNADILSGEQHHSVAYGMQRLVHSLQQSYTAKAAALMLPVLLPTAQHAYE